MFRGVVKLTHMQLQNLILPLAFLTSCALTPMHKASGCGNFDPCQTQNGIAVLAEPEIAQPILLLAQSGREAFQRYFGVEAAPIAIVLGGEITTDLHDDLKAAGYVLSLPWISAADKNKLKQSSIRRQVMEQTKGMIASQQEAILKMALAKASSAPSPEGDMSATEQGALTHELGHLWFIAAYKPAGEEVKGRHGYGGWAPDWLDETAAILLENETLTERRRNAFKMMKIEDLYPLETFLTMEHPALKSAHAFNKKVVGQIPSSGTRAIVLSGEEAEAFLKASGNANPANFYTQARGFADYVMTMTGDEQIFAKLARHLSKGGTVENWLSLTDGLADDVAALSQDWIEWVEAL